MCTTAKPIYTVYGTIETSGVGRIFVWGGAHRGAQGAECRGAEGTEGRGAESAEGRGTEGAEGMG